MSLPDEITYDMYTGLTGRATCSAGKRIQQSINALVLLNDNRLQEISFQENSAFLRVGDLLRIDGAMVRIQTRLHTRAPLITKIVPELMNAEIFPTTSGECVAGDFFLKAFGVSFKADHIQKNGYNVVSTLHMTSVRSPAPVVSLDIQSFFDLVHHGSTTDQYDELQTEDLCRVFLALAMLPETMLAEVNKRGLVIGQLQGNLYQFFSTQSVVILPRPLANPTTLARADLHRLQTKIKVIENQGLKISPIGLFEYIPKE